MNPLIKDLDKTKVDAFASVGGDGAKDGELLRARASIEETYRKHTIIIITLIIITITVIFTKSSGFAAPYRKRPQPRAPCLCDRGGSELRDLSAACLASQRASSPCARSTAMPTVERP